jgi:hypothetical protein
MQGSCNLQLQVGLMDQDHREGCSPALAKAELLAKLGVESQPSQPAWEGADPAGCGLGAAVRLQCRDTEVTI